MNRKEALRFLRGGKAGVRKWNRRREAEETIPSLSGVNLCGANLCGANLCGADLREANLHAADFNKANLRGADFFEANLRDADLIAADLSGADLSGADLREANFLGANLSGADLSGADLVDANLRDAKLNKTNFLGANLSGANLREANLRDANFSDAKLINAKLNGADLRGADFNRVNLSYTNLSEADLNGANLRYANITWSDLSNAVVDGAYVTHTVVHELKGLPKPPEFLRLDGGCKLQGEAARTFFAMPAIVEVFLSVQLSQIEIGCYHFHLGEVTASKVATGVFLVGFRHEGDGSVLRFQAETYAEIYDVLPDLLAPFPLAQAIDWKKSLESLPEQERSEAIGALMKYETRTAQGRWKFADKMAAMFVGYQDAMIYRIDEGQTKGFRLELFTNKEVRKRLTLAAEGLPKHGIGQLPPIQTGDGSIL